MKYYVITAINPLTAAREVVSLPMPIDTAKLKIKEIRRRDGGVYRLYRLKEYQPNQILLEL